MFEAERTVTFKQEVQGTWGVFAAPPGRVSFLMTKARLGTSGIDNERRLTALLRPVREVLDVKTLDFNQLLQRDLDDHRVSSALLPYLLKSRATGPSFLPPIVAVLLPFHNNRPFDHYPTCAVSKVEREKMQWEEERYGTALAFQKLMFANGSPHDIKLGRLSWNDEHARLMVVDGQHRAMALLAIERTLSGSWDRDGANRYKHFYESQIRQLLATPDAVALDEIEVPVTIIWFPGYDRPGKSAQMAARQIFVDINKEARAPSAARLILLSDAELVNVLTRSLLNKMKSGSVSLPLYSIEYDNPLRDAELPARWSVLTNINLLKVAVTTCVFGPAKHVEEVNVRFGGRLPWEEMNLWARKQLDVKSLFPEKIEDGERVYERDNLGNTYFPVGRVEVIINQFQRTWGEALLVTLAELSPYKAHVGALRELYEGWVTDDALGSLARDAIFEGVGMYWTLRDAFLAWQERRANTPRGQREPGKPDVAKAWDIVVAKEAEFRALRSAHFLGRANAADVKNVTSAFEVYKTHACQLGAVLTIAAIQSRTQRKVDEVGELARKIVAAWNASLAGAPRPGKTRQLVFSRDVPHPVNRVGKMDTPLAVYFRYLWLELLRTPEARAAWPDAPNEILDTLTSKARGLYVSYLEQEQIKALKKTHPAWAAKKLLEEARKKEMIELGKSLEHWFGVQAGDFDRWWLDNVSQAASPSVEAVVTESADAEEESRPADLSDAPEAVTLDQLASDDDE